MLYTVVIQMNNLIMINEVTNANYLAGGFHEVRTQYDTQRRGLCPNAHIVVKLSMGGCMNLRTRGRESQKYLNQYNIQSTLSFKPCLLLCYPTSRSEDII